MGQVETDRGNRAAEANRGSAGVDVGKLIAAYAGYAGISAEGMTLRELASAAEAAWQHTARIEAAIRDGLTPRKDKRPWDARLFNPFSARQQAKRGMSADDVRRFAGQFKRVRSVRASETRVQKHGS